MILSAKNENSLLVYYQTMEKNRLFEKLNLIKRRKPEIKENVLPPILKFNRVQLSVEASRENSRLGVKIAKLASNKSEYFSKVIGLPCLKKENQASISTSKKQHQRSTTNGDD